MGPKNPILISISFANVSQHPFYDEMLILNDRISSLTWLLKGMCIGPKRRIGNTPNHPGQKNILHLRPAHLLLQPGFRSIFAMSDWRIFFSSRIQWYLQDAALEGKFLQEKPRCFFFGPHIKLLTKKKWWLDWNDMEEKEQKHTIILIMIHPEQ